MSYTSDDPAPASTRWVPTCALCNNTVELETCKIDESGKAIHEECYLRKLIRLKRPSCAIVLTSPSFLGPLAAFVGSYYGAKPTRKKRTMSAAARKRIAAAQSARWAKIRAKKRAA
jgi:hypothetical protein